MVAGFFVQLGLSFFSFVFFFFLQPRTLFSRWFCIEGRLSCDGSNVTKKSGWEGLRAAFFVFFLLNLVLVLTGDPNPKRPQYLWQFIIAMLPNTVICRARAHGERSQTMLLVVAVGGGVNVFDVCFWTDNDLVYNGKPRELWDGVILAFCIKNRSSGFFVLIDDCSCIFACSVNFLSQVSFYGWNKILFITWFEV